MPFTPLTRPSAGTGGPVRWYLVRAGEVLTAGPGPLPGGPAGDPAGGIAVPAAALEGEPIFLGVDGDTACWAQGVTPETEAPDGTRWEPLMRLGSSLAADGWLVAGRAVQLVEWRRTSRYCGRCGAPTEGVAGERATRCPSCGLLAYPRLSPAVIVLVRRGREALLARNARFTGRVFSTIAGFVEPGETLEDAVRREVAEEVGVRLGAVGYFGSQPWPFPHSLMVGFMAEWVAGEIRVDGEEIAEAAWFSPDDLPPVPTRLSIARRLIDAWAGGTG